MKKLKQILTFSTAIVYFLVISFVALLSSVNTAYAADMDPREEAEVYQAAYFLAYCSNESGWASPRSTGEISSGDVFNRLSGLVQNLIDVNVGYLVDRSGSLACRSPGDVTKAFEILGESNTDFLTSAGIYAASDDNRSFSLRLNGNQARADAIINRARSLFPDANLGSEMSGAAKYFNALETFQRQCTSGDPLSSGGESIPIVNDTTGEQTTERYLIEGSGSKPVGFGYGARDGGGGDNANQQMICETIIQVLRDNADAAEARAKAIIGGGGTISGSGTVDSEESCAQRTALSFGWAVCGLLEFIASGVEGLMGAVDSLLNVDALELQNDEGLRTVWSYFRVIATFALLAIGLVMVISQAIGGNG